MATRTVTPSRVFSFTASSADTAIGTANNNIKAIIVRIYLSINLSPAALGGMKDD